jgi:hypothetical protein
MNRGLCDHTRRDHGDPYTSMSSYRTSVREIFANGNDAETKIAMYYYLFYARKRAEDRRCHAFYLQLLVTEVIQGYVRPINPYELVIIGLGTP